MKKVFLSVVLLAATLGAANAKTIIINKSNPGADGFYEKVGEVHLAESDTHSLSCFDPGPTGCGWTTSPWKVDRLEEAEHVATSAIQGLQMSGRVDMGDAIVSWTAESATNYDITIEVK